MFELDGFSVCQINKEQTGLSVDVLLSTASVNDEITKPYLWTESKIGYGLVYIRNDYKSHDEVETWIRKNYDVLMMHWENKLTDKETINILSKTKEK